jgi:TolB-like protein/tetratricopeptide (TPR) repeat protein
VADFSVLQIADWTLDAGSQRLVRDTEVRLLQPKELDVLLHLAASAPAVVTSDALLARTWPGTIVVDNALHRVIGKLRRALGDDARHPRYIETLSRCGYRLLAQVKFQPAGEAPTIAVLPLASRSDDPDQERFARGLSDELQIQISQLEGIRTIARTSSARFKRSDLGARAIGTQLRADYLLEGSINRSGEHIRIHILLVDTADATVKLTRAYERVLIDTRDLFALYDSIANDVRAALLPFAGLRREPPSRPPHTGDLIAHEIYLAGVSKFRETGDPRHLVEHGERALALDPASLSARFSRLDGIFYQAEMGFGPTRAGFECVRQEVLEILEHTPENAWALFLLGRIHAALDLDFPRALAAFDAAQRAGLARHEMAVWRAAIWLNADSPLRGLEVLREAESLDPLNVHVKDLLGRCYHCLGQRTESCMRFDEMLALEPNNRFNFFIAMIHCAFAGDAKRARDLLDAWEAEPIDQGWSEAVVRFLEGQSVPLATWVERAVATRSRHYVNAISISHAYYALGDYEQHMLWWVQRERSRESLHFVPYELAQYPDYWRTLRTWADGDRRMCGARSALLEEHSARVDRITRRMRL